MEDGSKHALEVILTHILISSIAMHTSDAPIRCLLTRVEVLRGLFAVRRNLGLASCDDLVLNPRWNLSTYDENFFAALSHGSPPAGPVTVVWSLDPAAVVAMPLSTTGAALTMHLLRILS